MDILFGFTTLAFVFKVAHIHQLADELNKYDKCETGICEEEATSMHSGFIMHILCVWWN